MARTTPAWMRLVDEGFFETRQDAQRWILAGKVYAGNTPVQSEGQAIAKEAVLTVKGLDMPYVAKGGLKLEGALADFAVDVTDRVCMDAGASTGGFTDCLRKHGAARVYAVDVGYGQLAGSLRNDPTVVNLEKTNISEASLLSLDPRPTLGTVDLSYLSLRKAVPAFAEILHGEGELICLVKPLFEVQSAQARRTGILQEEQYLPLLLDLSEDLACQGFAVCGITHSRVTGNGGTLEFFFHIPLGEKHGPSFLHQKQAAQAAVKAALALPIYHKQNKGD